jgi:hypothetical protein
MEGDDYRSGCPINLSVEVFGDKWSLLILRDQKDAAGRIIHSAYFPIHPPSGKGYSRKFTYSTLHGLSPMM